MSRWEKLPDEKRDHWPAAYEWVFVRPAPPAAWTGMERFRQDAGITDRLIIKAIEIAHTEAGGSLFAYATEILSRCAADEITTVEEYEASQATRAAAKEQRAQERAAARVTPIRKQAQPSTSGGPRWTTGTKPPGYYDYAEKKFAN